MSLREKLESLQKEDLAGRESAKARLSEWLTAISKLYGFIEQELSDLIKDEYVKPPSRTSADREEELVGRYKVEELNLMMGRRTIVFSPVATFVIGAHGRIDLFVKGRMGRRYKILWDKTSPEPNQWRIMPDERRKQPLSELPILSRATLEEAFEKLLGI